MKKVTLYLKTPNGTSKGLKQAKEYFDQLEESGAITASMRDILDDFEEVEGGLSFDLNSKYVKDINAISKFFEIQAQDAKAFSDDGKLEFDDDSFEDEYMHLLMPYINGGVELDEDQLDEVFDDMEDSIDDNAGLAETILCLRNCLVKNGIMVDENGFSRVISQLTQEENPINFYRASDPVDGVSSVETTEQLNDQSNVHNLVLPKSELRRYSVTTEVENNKLDQQIGTLISKLEDELSKATEDSEKAKFKMFIGEVKFLVQNF